MNQAYLWSETIDASYRGKGELSSRPQVTPLPDLGDTARRLIKIRWLEMILTSHIKMTASSSRSKRAYINRLFEVVVGSCQQESALTPLILKAAFVTNSDVGAMF